MPRQPRYELIDVPQHVVQRGNNRQAAFFADADYSLYKECLVEAARRHACDVHAYVLMTNHVHLLVTPHEPLGVAKLMQSIGRKYVRHVNDHYLRTGTLWEGRYKASLVDSDHYLLVCSRYIELNPVRAGMVADPADYRWSSYRRNAWTKPDSCISEHPRYTALGTDFAARSAAYRELFRAAIDPETLGEIRTNLNRCNAVGSDRFKDAIEAVLARRVRIGQAGRPKKQATVSDDQRKIAV